MEKNSPILQFAEEKRRRKGANFERILDHLRKISNPLNFHNRNRFNRKPIQRLIIPPSESRGQFTSHRLQLHRFFPKSICSLHRLIYLPLPRPSPANNLSSCYLIDRFHPSSPRGKREGSNEKRKKEKKERDNFVDFLKLCNTRLYSIILEWTD